MATKTKSNAKATTTATPKATPKATPATPATPATTAVQYAVTNASGFKGLNLAVITATNHLVTNGQPTTILNIATQMATAPKAQGGYIGRNGQATLGYCKQGVKWATQNPKRGIILTAK